VSFLRILTSPAKQTCFGEYFHHDVTKVVNLLLCDLGLILWAIFLAIQPHAETDSSDLFQPSILIRDLELDEPEKRVVG
jgi:hypothetical protein